MITILFWIAFGVLVGWVTAILQHETSPLRVGIYLVAGSLGGLAGGFGGGLLGPANQNLRTGSPDVMFTVFGAIAFVVLVRVAADRYSQQ
jgi:uncharacterized membrane protein YeaQ/YmgE (transglycosylase-associated protein family)